MCFQSSFYPRYIHRTIKSYFTNQVLFSHKNYLTSEFLSGVRGIWVASSDEGPALEFGPGHDLTVHEREPHIRLCADSMELAWDSLSPSLSASHPLTLSLNLCLKINFKTFLKVFRGSWVVHWVKHLTSAQVMISRLMGSSPISVSVLTLPSLLGILTLSLSLCPSLTCTFSLSQNK